jgi:hypothetical protein
MTDQQIAAGNAPPPVTITVQGSQQLLTKLAYAAYDGSGAAGDFLPVVKFVGPGGQIAGQAVGDVVTAGASVDQTWFRGLAKQGSAKPPAAAPYAAYDHQQVVPTATQTLLTWVHALGPSPLNLAVPTLPTFITAGIYSVTVMCICFVPVAGAFAQAFLFDSVTSLGGQSFPLSTAGPSTLPACSISATRNFTAGDQIGVNFFHNAGVNKTVELFANVQQIG